MATSSSASCNTAVQSALTLTSPSDLPHTITQRTRPPGTRPGGFIGPLGGQGANHSLQTRIEFSSRYVWFDALHRVCGGVPPGLYVRVDVRGAEYPPNFTACAGSAGRGVRTTRAECYDGDQWGRHSAHQQAPLPATLAKPHTRHSVK